MRSGRNSRRLNFEHLETRVAPSGLLLCFPSLTSASAGEQKATAVEATELETWRSGPVSVEEMRTFLESETRDLQQDAATRDGAASELPDPAQCDGVDRFMETVR